MQVNTLLGQGVELMLIGMGTVFVFLTLLVFATKAMSALAQRLQPAQAIVPPQQEQDEQVVAAIAGAIAQHRQR